MSEPPRCDGCRYWVSQPDPEDGTPMGVCRRLPPSYEGWPMTLPQDWCGEFTLAE